MCFCLDLRPDSGMANFLSHKIVALIIGVIQMIIWILALFALIAPPESVKYQIRDSKAGVIAVAVIIILAAIGFSILFIFGVLKNNKTIVHVYCFFIIVLIVLLIMGVMVNIFTQPARFGLSGFLSSCLSILLNVLTYFIVRNYYLSLIKLPQSHNAFHNPTTMRV